MNRHELKNLLNAVNGLAMSVHAALEMLLQKDIPPHIRRELEEIFTDAKMLLEKSAALADFLSGEGYGNDSLR